MLIKKQKKSDRTRSLIIEKTSSLFNKRGYANTSLSDLTKATGLTKGSIYGNFRNKEEVALEVFKYNIKKIEIPLFNDINKQKNSVQKLLAFPQFFRQQYKFITENGGCALLNTSVEADDLYDELRTSASKVIDHWVVLLSEIIEEGKKEESIVSETEAVKTAQVILALYQGGIALSKCTRNKQFFISAIEQIESVINNIKNNIQNSIILS